MAVPIFKRITDDLIASVKRARTVGGYSFDAEVERVNAENNRLNTPRDGLVVVGIQDAEPADNPPMGHSEWFQNYDLTVYTFESEASEVTTEDRAWARIQDLIKAVMADPHRGSFALWTTVGTPRMADDRRTSVLPVRVHYRTLIHDPFNQ